MKNLRAYQWRLIGTVIGAILAGCGGLEVETDSAQVTTYGTYQAQQKPGGTAAGADTLLTAELSKADSAAALVPSFLKCVSAVDKQRGVPSVWRLWIGINGQKGTVQIRSSYQFLAHGNEKAGTVSSAAPDNRPVTVSTGSKLRLVQTSVNQLGLKIELVRQGQFFTGSFVDEQAYVVWESKLTCWSDAELGISPWGGQPTNLAAHYDPETGRCVDKNNKTALNQLPLAFVREMGFGECADLCDAKLNDNDYGYPVLANWNLNGAKLDGAQLYFARLTGASLLGAQLSKIKYGYAWIDGYTDAFTTVPQQGCKSVSPSPWGGPSQLSCAQ